MRYLLIWAGIWLLYIGLSGDLSTAELVTGAAVGATCAGWAALVRRHARRQFAAGATHLAPWGRCFAHLLPETLAAAMVLWRSVWRGGPIGALRAQRFVPGAGPLPQTHARRATALLCASLAPARFIVRLEPMEGQVLVHEIVPTPQLAADESLLASAREERWLV